MIITPQVSKTVSRWLEEGTSDLLIDWTAIFSGYPIVEPGTLAGCCLVDELFRQLGCSVTWIIKEGAEMHIDSSHSELLESSLKHGILWKNRTIVATVRGAPSMILLGERLCLNILSRCSGIASKFLNFRYSTHNAVKIAKECGYTGRIAGTRKTTPGFRIAEKWALIVGGADPHRFGLSSMPMFKDNDFSVYRRHKKDAGCISQLTKDLLQKAKNLNSFSMPLEVEAQSETEAIYFANCDVDIIMLDNFHHTKAIEAAKQIKKINPAVKVEASGGINIHNFTSYFDENINVISMGSLTNIVPSMDFSLKINHRA